jgi:hypothetical protein
MVEHYADGDLFNEETPIRYGHAEYEKLCGLGARSIKLFSGVAFAWCPAVHRDVPKRGQSRKLLSNSNSRVEANFCDTSKCPSLRRRSTALQSTL